MTDIYVENPPASVDPTVSDYLIRQFTEVNEGLRSGQLFVPRYREPEKVKVGQVIYFAQPVPPDITAEGLWVYTSTGWLAVATV